MKNIKQSIYSRPEIRHCIKPLWTAWVLVAIGAVSALIYLSVDGLSPNVASLFVYTAGLGACSLLFVLCFYLFGDSRFPYSTKLRSRLEPTYAYYDESSLQPLTDALAQCDEAALGTIKRISAPGLVLVRYSDTPERVYHSQILRREGKKLTPLTDIYINEIQK